MLRVSVKRRTQHFYNPAQGNALDLTTKLHYCNYLYDYIGNVHRNKWQLNCSPSYVISLGADRLLSIDLPLEWFSIKLTSPKDDQRDRQYFSFAPSLYFKYRITDLWKFMLSASINADNMTSDFYSPYIVRSGYRTEYMPNDDIFVTQSKRVSARLSYRNLATMFFSNISVSYADEKKEYYTQYKYTDVLTTISLVRGNNRSRTLMTNITADKSFTDAGVALKSDINYNLRSYLISQSGVQTQNSSNVLGANLSVLFQKWKWLRLSIGASGHIYWERNHLYDSEALQSLVTNASVFLFPTKSTELKFKYLNYTNELPQSQYRHFGIFAVDFNYKINKRWEVGTSLTNILNTRSYTIIQDSGINSFYSNLPLRGREFLCRVLWRI